MDVIGIIGGSGLYEIEGLKKVREIKVNTPFGKPSDSFVTGELNGVKVAFLSRHGRGHTLSPSEINYRANIFAFKKLGVSSIISVSAVGSMKGEIKPGAVVIPDQFFDRTYKRPNTFFEKGIVAHVSMAHPVCKSISEILFHSGIELNYVIKNGGTYLCIEGPQFSTKGESFLYRELGFDVIGMTNMPEARLSREAEICYATLALVTDYDCWYESEDAVTVEIILETLKNNIIKAKEIIRRSIKQISSITDCQCRSALKSAIITAPEKITKAMKYKLKPIIWKYVQ